MQKIINELEEKQADTNNLRRFIGELEDQLRVRDQDLQKKARDYEHMVREKDGKIRDLEHTVNMNNTRITQLESLLKSGDDKNNKLR